MTQWTPDTQNKTVWTGTTPNATEFDGRDIINLGAIMDDPVYTMDSALINMDDAKLNPIYAPSTNWT